MRSLTSLETPHPGWPKRIFARLQRMTRARPFRSPNLAKPGLAITLHPLKNANALLDFSPSNSVAFGIWDSTASKVGLGGQVFSDALVGEIIRHDIVTPVKKPRAESIPLQIVSGQPKSRTHESGLGIAKRTTRKLKSPAEKSIKGNILSTISMEA